MKYTFRISAIAIGMISGFGMTVPAAAENWVCSAKNLVNYQYTGGSRAMIHLSPYNSGGSYKVTKVSDAKVTGKTKDGTPFTCIKK